MTKAFLFALPFAALFLLNPSAQAETEPGQICETQAIMTLPWTICLVDSSRKPAELRAYIKEGMEEIRRIDRWMSEWKATSVVSEINRNAGVKPVKVNQEVIDAIELALEHGKLTHGAFDITFNAFFGLYSWKPGHERFPSEADVKRLLPLVNYKNVIVDRKAMTVFLKEKGMKIGLGGMGEGWAIDKVYQKLHPKHIQAGYIDASGGVRVWGRKPSGKLWTIGVGNPRPMSPENSRKETLFNLYGTNLAVTTAGDTEKYFEKNGKRYHHIIDPKTGYSADKSAQVTAICKTATLCDLVDDGVYILGPVEGRKYAEKLGVAAVMIDPKKNIAFTDGLRPIDTKWGKALSMDPKIDLR
jgi:thiamine biosynthesis lipoprotein